MRELSSKTLIGMINEKYPKILERCFDCYVPNGWNSLILRSIDQIVQIDPTIKIIQIKEKFGLLIIYTENDLIVKDILNQAYEESYRICSICSVDTNNSPENLNGTFYPTVCDQCKINGLVMNFS